MRFSKLLLTAAIAGFAAVAAAQDNSPPAEDPEVKAEPSPGLSDLKETVDQLLREEGQPVGQQPPATPPPAETETPPVTAETESPPPAPAEPEASPPTTQEAEPQPPATPEPEAPPPAPALPAQPPAPAPPATEGPAPPLTREQTAALDRVMERGRLLVASARAGLMATQDMLTRISDPNGAGIAGWIAEPAGNSEVVTFYALGAEGAAPAAVYRATVLGGRVTSREIFLGADRPPLSPIQARMAAARAASESEEMRACSTQPFNVIIVPPATARASVDVYRISVPTQRDRFPLGGHYRSTVAADGSVELHSLTRACVDAEVPAAVAGQPPRPLAVTHLLDPMPTEVHMLLAQTVGRPLLVVTGDPHRVWLVTGDRIAEVRG